MTDYNNTNDSLVANEFESDKLPSGLNVLTILTFIGSAFALLGGIWNFYNAKKTFDTKDKVMEQMNSGSMPSWLKSIMPNMTHFEEMVTKSYENRIPIFILTVVAAILCIVGAMQMRKRQKQGYLFYVIGEILPLIVSTFFIGFFTLSGGGGIFGIGLTLLFVILYTMQRKHLIH
jgi:uncharacterized membrane protein